MDQRPVPWMIDIIPYLEILRVLLMIDGMSSLIDEWKIIEWGSLSVIILGKEEFKVQRNYLASKSAFSRVPCK